MEKELIKLGYNRKSTQQQDLKSDHELLEKYGCNEIFEEKKSGTKIEGREELQKLLKRVDELIAEGYEVEVDAPKVDRFARSIKDLSNLIDRLAEKGATVVFIEQGLSFNKKIAENDPMASAFISMLGIFAQMERDFIVSRTTRGREYKRETDPNYREGRKKKLRPIEAQNLYKRYEMGETVTDLANSYNMSRTTIYKYINDYEAKHLKLD